jgi:hypothetical protein
MAGASGEVLFNAPYVGPEVQDFNVQTILSNPPNNISSTHFVPSGGYPKTHVDLLHLRSQLGDILLDCRGRAQPLELLFNGFYTLEVIGHLRNVRRLAFKDRWAQREV